MPPSAFIIDIDGTLVNLHQIWKQTYNSLYQNQQGFSLTDEEMKSMFGPPELECHSAILKGRNLYTPEQAESLVQATEQSMLATLTRVDVAQHILPGVHDFLEYLQKWNIPRAVATGNIQSIANAILHHAGLESYFPVVAFSTPQTSRRADIVRDAYNQLQNKSRKERIFEPQEIYVVGDTPSDIIAAKELGFSSVAVATGNYATEELLKENPTLWLYNLSGYERIFSLRCYDEIYFG